MYKSIEFFNIYYTFTIVYKQKKLFDKNEHIDKITNITDEIIECRNFKKKKLISFS